MEQLSNMEMPSVEDLLQASPKHIWRRSFRRFRNWRTWRNLAVYFCVFSLVGHWFEYPYCLFNDYFFGIVDADSMVWVDPLTYPFMVYGFAVVIAAIVLVPYWGMLVSWRQSHWKGNVHFFIVSVFIAMALELTQGFLQNMPDENGVYPLWDNSQLPGNILGQAWIVNDVLLGTLLLLFVRVLFPLLERYFGKLSDTAANIISGVIIVGFIILTIVEYSING